MLRSLPEVVVDQPPPANQDDQRGEQAGNRRAQEAEYVVAIVEQTEELSASFTAISELAGNPQFGDEGWAARFQISSTIGKWPKKKP